MICAIDDVQNICINGVIDTLQRAAQSHVSPFRTKTEILAASMMHWEDTGVTYITECNITVEDFFYFFSAKCETRLLVIHSAFVPLCPKVPET